MIRFDRPTARDRGLRVSLPDLVLGPTPVAFVGAAPDGVGVALALAAGALRPRAGRVMRDAEDTTAVSSRRRCVHVPLQPDMPGDATVSEWLAVAAAVRGQPPASPATLERFGIAPLADVRIGSLERPQRRTVALVEGLASPRVDLVVLHEPLAWLEGALLSELEALITSDRARTWIVGTASAIDAARLAPRAIRLESSKVTFDGPASELAAHARGYDAVIVATPDVRSLAAACASDVSLVSLEALEGALVVRARDAHEAASIVGRGVVASGARVESLEPLPRRTAGGAP